LIRTDDLLLTRQSQSGPSPSRAQQRHETRTSAHGSLPVRSALRPKSRGEDPTCHDERVSDDLVSVLWTSSLVEAEIAKGRLEAESIPVQLVGEGADDPFPVGPAELLVPSKFEEEARRILAQSEDGSDRS
jgi:Putative prokaryotic signal transducing protein